jgi:hypothetical protein
VLTVSNEDKLKLRLNEAYDKLTHEMELNNEYRGIIE